MEFPSGRADPPGAALSGDPTRAYGLHGVSLEVSSDDSSLFAPVHAILEHFGLTAGGEGSAASALRLYLTTNPGRIAVADGAEEIAWQDGIQALSTSGRIYLRADGQALVLDASSGAAVALLPATSVSPRKDLILYGLLILLRRRGLFALHASGVRLGEAGCLLVGPSGSGKSTLTYALVRAGCPYLGDDAVLLRTGEAMMDALALRRDLCLDPALATHFPELTRYGEAGDFAGKGKRRLPMGRLYADRLLQRFTPRVLLFPEIVPESRSRLLPLRMPDVLARLAAQSAVLGLDPEMGGHHVRVLAELARQSRAYRLLAGRDLEAAPRSVISLLASVGIADSSPFPVDSRDANTEPRFASTIR